MAVAKKSAQKVKALVAGNWKMNGVKKDLAEVKKLAATLAKNKAACEVMICPPATLLSRIADLKVKGIALGGQDAHANESGAHTGDISMGMLKDAGAKAVVLGHSERRADHGETNKQVKAKVEAAHKTGLTAIMCIGESLKERKKGDTLKVVQAQLRGSLPAACTAKNTVIAYEPVWAIGTGLTATPQQAEETHRFIRGWLATKYDDAAAEAMRIQYGGSVKPGNAAELLSQPNIDGALVGGESLKAETFLAILACASGS